MSNGASIILKDREMVGAGSELGGESFELPQISDNLTFMLLSPLCRQFSKSCTSMSLLIQTNVAIWHLCVGSLTWLYFFKKVCFVFINWALCGLLYRMVSILILPMTFIHHVIFEYHIIIIKSHLSIVIVTLNIVYLKIVIVTFLHTLYGCLKMKADNFCKTVTKVLIHNT
jgi:hypothetical protein